MIKEMSCQFVLLQNSSYFPKQFVILHQKSRMNKSSALSECTMWEHHELNWMTLWWGRRTLSLVRHGSWRICRMLLWKCLLCGLLCTRIKRLKCQTAAAGMFRQMLALPRWWISSVSYKQQTTGSSASHLSMQAIRGRDVISKGTICPSAVTHHQSVMFKEFFVMKSANMVPTYFSSSLFVCYASAVDFLHLVSSWK